MSTPSHFESRIDLTTCAREPIHIPGSIQPHGVLLGALGETLTVKYASANASRVALPPSAILGRPLAELLPLDTCAQIKARAEEMPSSTPAAYITHHVSAANEQFDVLAHRQGDLLILEFEPTQIGTGATVERTSELAADAASAECARTLIDLCQATVNSIRRLTDFDKVMVYRFDPEWNGTVLAEKAPPEMHRYLDQRFPASDIPAQARELYRLNPVRFIADVAYEPCVIQQQAGATGPLDLTYSVLRSVSPIHIEYLKNMHIGASMSISLIVDGRLWGLIACHHRTPKHLPQAIRAECVLLARFTSHLIAGAVLREEAACATETRAVQARVVKCLRRGENPARGLAECGPDLLRLAGADGAGICVDGEYHQVGNTPPAEVVRRMGKWAASLGEPLFHTDWLPGHVPEAEQIKDTAAGVLVISLSAVYHNYIIWFRPEVIQTIQWAGDPHKPAVAEPGQRLHPRKSFEVWREQVGRRSVPWQKPEVEAAGALREALIDVQLRRAEEEATQAKDNFLAVLSHELRTPLNPVLIAASSLEADPGLPADARDLMKMIRRNVEVETRLIDDLLDLTRVSKGKMVLNPELVDLHALISDALKVFDHELNEKGIRLIYDLGASAHHVEGDPVRLQQVLWNVLKNAIKFTPPAGDITVRTTNAESARVQVDISDSGVGIAPEVLPNIFNAFEQGGRVVTSRYGGLGLGLAIAKTLTELHHGRLTAASRGKGHGATFTLDLPTVPPPEPVTEATRAKVQSGPTMLQILLVEDHMDTARVMAKVLTQLQYKVKVASSIGVARDMLEREKFDLLISDLSLPDGSGNELMAEARTRGLRGIALTGYGMEDDIRKSKVAGFAYHLTKPVDIQSLERAIRDVSNHAARK